MVGVGEDEGAHVRKVLRRRKVLQQRVVVRLDVQHRAEAFRGEVAELVNTKIAAKKYRVKIITNIWYYIKAIFILHVFEFVESCEGLLVDVRDLVVAEVEDLQVVEAAEGVLVHRAQIVVAQQNVVQLGQVRQRVPRVVVAQDRSYVVVRKVSVR